MNLVLESPTKLPPSLGLYLVQWQNGRKADPVIDLVEEEEEEEWPEVGAQNVEEAEHYTDKITTFSIIFWSSSMKTSKQHYHKQSKISRRLSPSNGKAWGTPMWTSSSEQLKTQWHYTLRQHLTARGVEVVDPPEELPSGKEFLWQLPERARQVEEMAFIVDIFSHAAQAHEHLSEVCANVAALAKITDKTTLMSVINGAVWLLVQLNIPEGFLNPVQDKKSSDIRRREERKSEKDGAAHPRRHLLETQTSKWPNTHFHSSSVVKDVPKIFQWRHSKGGVRAVQHQSKAVILSVDWQEVPRWYTSLQVQGHDEPPAKWKKDG